jgi:hypothetical protein
MPDNGLFDELARKVLARDNEREGGTYDSLLGRQEVARSPLAWYRLAAEADRAGACVFYAALTKDFACSWQKISRPLLDFVIRFGHKRSRSL